MRISNVVGRGMQGRGNVGVALAVTALLWAWPAVGQQPPRGVAGRAERCEHLEGTAHDQPDAQDPGQRHRGDAWTRDRKERGDESSQAHHDQQDPRGRGGAFLESLGERADAVHQGPDPEDEGDDLPEEFRQKGA